MLRIGLTGGIAAGKTTVARALVSRGAVLVDADLLAREVVAAGTEGFAEVRAAFGDGVVGPDGGLDRAALGRVVFADAERRRVLEAIVHPRVAARRAVLAAAAPVDAVVVEDVPLLVEKGLGVDLPLVVVVHAPAEERVRRLVAERGMSADDAWARVRAQADDAARRAAADVWLDNSGEPAAVEVEVDRLWRDRLVPFEANLRAGRWAPRTRPTLVPYDPTWPQQAARLLTRVAAATRDLATRRIEHIGSTSVPGLSAKDVLDLQVVVADLDAAAEVAARVGRLGLVRRTGRWSDTLPDGSEADKVLVVNADPGRAVNLHVRQESSPAWRDTVALRDWLRAHPDQAADYARLKGELAARYDDVNDYADAKTDWINAALAAARRWAGDPS